MHSLPSCHSIQTSHKASHNILCLVNYKLHLRSAFLLPQILSVCASNSGDIQNIQKLRSHSYKKYQLIQKIDLGEQYFFLNNTAISEQSQNSFTGSTFRAYGIFLNLNSRQYLLFRDQLRVQLLWLND